MTARILHISDLHIGRNEMPERVSMLRELAREIGPELIVATGDLAHRGRRAQLEQAAEFLRDMGAPVLAVPGNHDLPYTLPARFTRPFSEWERVFETSSPVYTSEALVVVGLNSVRPWRHQSGALGAGALERVASTFASAPGGALRVVALHHHLAAPPWRARHKRPVHRRDDALRALADAGTELVLSGHVHQASIAERREFEVLERAPTSLLVLTTVPGFGRPRPRRRGEALGLNVYEADERRLTVITHAWSGTSFGEVGRRSFSRG